MAAYSVPRIYIPRPDRLILNWRSGQRDLAIDHATVNKVLAEYDLKFSNNPQLPPGGGRSHSLVINTLQGKKILKRYKQSLGRPTIIQEHSILDYLAQINFPAPRLVAKKARETLVYENNIYYALFDFIEGGFQYQNYMLLPGQTRQFIMISGEMLAKLHHALTNFVPQGCNPDGFKSQHEDRPRNLDWFLDKLSDCVEKTSTSTTNESTNQAAWLLQQARYLEGSLIKLDDRLRQAALPRVIIHGDYGPYNLLFRPKALPVVLDFEMARLDWRIMDIIQAWPRFIHNRLGFKLNKMKWFITGYQTYLRLTENELQLIPDVWKFFYIRQCILYWYRYCQTSTQSWLTKGLQSLQWVDWMIANEKLMI